MNNREIEKQYEDRFKGLGFEGSTDAAQCIENGGVVILLRSFNVSDVIDCFAQLYMLFSEEQKKSWKRMCTRVYYLIGDPVRATSYPEFIYTNESCAVTTLLTANQCKKLLAIYPRFSGKNPLEQNYIEKTTLKSGSRVAFVSISPVLKTEEQLLVTLGHLINEAFTMNKVAANTGFTIRREMQQKLELLLDKSIASRITQDGAGSLVVEAVLYE